MKTKLFAGEMETYSTFMRDNLEWLLQKNKYEYQQDEIVALLDLAKRLENIIIKTSQDKLRSKFKELVDKFLIE